MERYALKLLQTWKERPNRVPLLLRGARQVGKTWLVRQFGKSFASFVEFNLEAQTELHRVFRDFFGKPEELVRTLSSLRGEQIIPGKTLLFLDEIQESKEAILALRYFKEELPALHVVAAGSLLEFAIRELSFPVGRIEFFHLFPMNFEEFLIASGREDLVQEIQKTGIGNSLPQTIHDLIIEQVALFCLCGGMPEVVQAYTNTKDLNECQTIQQRLIGNFREDFYKYARRGKIELLRKTFDSIPRLLGQKFKYVNVDPETRSKELSLALDLLVEAAIAHKVCHSSAQGLPLSAQANVSRFKVYFLDVGLVQRLLGLPLSQLFLERKTLLANRGPIAEQFVAQDLLSYTPQNQTPQLHYWHRESRSAQAEVDFVIEHRSRVLPLEVKSSRGHLTRSLQLFLQEHPEAFQPALKVSAENFHQRGNITIMPFYALSKLIKD